MKYIPGQIWKYKSGVIWEILSIDGNYEYAELKHVNGFGSRKDKGETIQYFLECFSTPGAWELVSSPHIIELEYV